MRSSILSLTATFALGAALSLTAVACGDDDEDTGTGPGTATEIQITEGAEGGSLTLAAGASADLEVAVFDDRGNDLDDAVITASSSNETVATATGGGGNAALRLAHTDFTVSGIGAGTATLTFRDQESGVSADLPVIVTAP